MKFKYLFAATLLVTAMSASAEEKPKAYAVSNAHLDTQ